jgi:ACS family tartrate transporter-like MFS transporter
MSQIVEQQIMRKLNLRLIPFLIFLYVVSYLDRVNVSFAALTMNKEIGLNPYIYGWGAGIFFIGYCVFEVPADGSPASCSPGASPPPPWPSYRAARVS